MQIKPKDMPGKVFGRLTVVRAVGKDRFGAIFLECSCECGGSKITRGYSLRRGYTRSCGCITAENAWDHPRKHRTSQDAAWYFNWGQYKRNIKHRQLEMSLTLEEFKEISSKPCYYCHAGPERRPSQRGRSEIHASGIDRIDNSKGYVVENMVPCCTWCNRSKSSHSIEYFVQHCIAVTNAAIARNE